MSLITITLHGAVRDACPIELRGRSRSWRFICHMESGLWSIERPDTRDTKPFDLTDQKEADAFNAIADDLFTPDRPFEHIVPMPRVLSVAKPKPKREPRPKPAPADPPQSPVDSPAVGGTAGASTVEPVPAPSAAPALPAPPKRPARPRMSLPPADSGTPARPLTAAELLAGRNKPVPASH